jgi:hypothetical protein
VRGEQRPRPVEILGEQDAVEQSDGGRAAGADRPNVGRERGLAARDVAPGARLRGRRDL